MTHLNIFLAVVKNLEQNKGRAIFHLCLGRGLLALRASSLSPPCCLAPPRSPAVLHQAQLHAAAGGGGPTEKSTSGGEKTR